MTASRGLRGLYVITDTHLMPEERFLSMVSEALDGGARLVQLREKRAPDNDMLELAVTLRRLCDEYDAMFIVNDHVDLAVSCNAHGVHIGEDDSDLAHARALMKTGIIGVSCYNDLHRAKAMERAGADYVAFGSFFPSPTKPDARRAEVSLLEQAREELQVPICAIGGVTVDNARDLVMAGADMVAVISDIWRAQDICQQAMRFAALYQ